MTEDTHPETFVDIDQEPIKLWHTYQISDKGNVRWLLLNGEYRNLNTANKIYKAQSYSFVILTGINPDTGRVKLLYRTVHSLVARYFLGPWQYNLIVLHGPKGPKCNDLSNLSYGTHKQNAQDRIRDGTHQWGTKSSLAAFNEMAIWLIRYDYLFGDVKIVDIARRYGVTYNTVYNIIRKKTYVDCH